MQTSFCTILAYRLSENHKLSQKNLSFQLVETRPTCRFSVWILYDTSSGNLSSPADKHTAALHESRLGHLTFVTSKPVHASLRNHIPYNYVRILQRNNYAAASTAIEEKKETKRPRIILSISEHSQKWQTTVYMFTPLKQTRTFFRVRTDSSSGSDRCAFWMNLQ